MIDLRHNRALTLVEMLVVVSIIAVLATFVITLTRRVENQSKEHALANAYALLETALQEYHEYKGEFPEQSKRDANFAATHAELMYEALRSVPDSRAVLAKINRVLIKGDSGDRRRIHDVWGTAIDYIYAPGDNFPELISAGPDREFGTGDDISNQDL